MGSPGIEILGGVICDDIRKEDNGKAILIGVYSGDILISSFPFQRPICLWLHGRAEKGIYDMEVRIRTVGENDELAPAKERKIKADFSSLESSEMAISIVGVPISVNESSEIILEVKLAQQEWSELSRKRIKLASSSTVPELPFEK